MQTFQELVRALVLFSVFIFFVKTSVSYWYHQKKALWMILLQYFTKSLADTGKCWSCAQH